MFTGIVETTGKITTCHQIGKDARITIAVGQLDMSDVALGDSIAVNGTCVTVIAFTATTFSADVSAETLSLTAAKQWVVGATVNLEKALMPQTRMGGHMMSGHVDGVGRVMSKRPVGVSVGIQIEVPRALMRYIAKKGSIALDGISLTVNEISGNQFTVNIVPHTLERTNLDGWSVGTDINIEVDIVARYLERLVLGGQGDSAYEVAASSRGESSAITEAFLIENGYGR